MNTRGKETVRARRVFEVYAVFTTLGLVGFGGPAAHLALFRTVFTQKRRWLDAARYDSLVALCQFLPGPGSSQTAAAVGWERAGRLGALAAILGFATPSLILMGLAGWGAAAFADRLDRGVIGGLLAGAAAVVAGAVMSMARTQAATPARAAIAGIAFALVLGATLSPVPLAAVQPGVVALGALGGFAVLGRRGSGPSASRRTPAPWRGVMVWLFLFTGLLIALPWLAQTGEAGRLADTAYRAGALVFGGGHVVLPLVQAGAVPALIEEETFLAGYSLAQAIPGPLFTFSAFLGAAAADTPLQAAAYGLIAGLAIFAPGLFLVFAVLPVWNRLEAMAGASAAVAGASAAVTGLLGAALIDPVLLAVPASLAGYVILAGALIALRALKAPPPLVIVACGLAGWGLL
ncbi:MAG: chromate efflux transporter [Oceanicaulis sp.]